MPVAFFETVLSPEFNARNGVIYVLPDIKSVREVFPAAYDPSSQSGVAKVSAVTPQMQSPVDLLSANIGIFRWRV